MNTSSDPLPLESEADRVSALYGLGAQRVTTPDGSLLAFFDNAYSSVAFDFTDIEARTPFLTCRSSDVKALRKDDALQLGTHSYRVMRIEPDTPAPGWTVILLRA